MNNRIKILLLAALSLILIGIFLFANVGANWGYIVPRRALKVGAIVITGVAIAFSTIIFQTITNNRILTPSIMGLDSLYLVFQTYIVYMFGSTSILVVNQNYNFLLSMLLMVLFAALFYKILFAKERRNIYMLLLIGIIFGTLFDSIATFMQVLIDPNEFLMVQSRMFASFNQINADVLWVASIVLLIATAYFMRFYKYLDVLSLGREEAINLGVPYDTAVKHLLVIVSILVSIATALVGPITFLGLLVANVAYEVFKTYKHSYLIVGGILISIIALVGGQLLIERVFTFSTTLSVIINFIGGVYFIYLLLRGNRT
jgi:iron complex transport system permease protein